MTYAQSPNETLSFQQLAPYFGISLIGPEYQVPSTLSYKDLESFFLKSTVSLSSSRVAEAMLCWMIEYGHLLNPSKIRLLLKKGHIYDPAVLGGMIEFVSSNKISDKSWKILSAFTKKSPAEQNLFSGPRVRQPQPDFAKLNLLIPNFKLDIEKFLTPKKYVLENCIELKFRTLFGSASHADLASALKRHPELTKYQAHKITNHHKATIFKIYDDVRIALAA